MKKIIGGVITLVIGGTVFTVSQADVAKNFQKDTGLSQQEAEQYVEEVKEEDLIPYDKLGSEMVSDGKDVLSTASEIDCINYEYEWVTYTLSCEEGVSQLRRIGNNEIALGKAYIILASEDATQEDISLVIKLIDKVNTDLNLEVVSYILDSSTIDEISKSNSYNKAVLKAALDSN